MKRVRRRVGQQETFELWRRWRSGESLKDIASALQVWEGTVRQVVSSLGGVAPQLRRRSGRSLSLPEREEISRGISCGLAMREIAAGIGRAPSTVSREIARNGGRSKYRATASDIAAWRRAQRPKQGKLAATPQLRRLVAQKLRRNWSPEQISGWLRKRYPDDEDMQVSHETIYRTLFIQARGALKKELMKHLRSRRTLRRAKLADRSKQGRGQIIDMISIRERPAEAEDRAVPGHWEGDLISGSNNSHIATLVERHSRYVMLVKVAGKDSESVVAALAKQVKRLPAELRKSLTWDRGREMAKHKKFSLATSVQVYFRAPRSPWQRGSNENTNGLLRQYFPRSLDLREVSQAKLNAVARELNERPRKTLDFDSPAERLNGTVATTG